MNIKKVRESFDRIDAEVTVDKSVEGFSQVFVDGICRVLNGGDE